MPATTMPTGASPRRPRPNEGGSTMRVLAYWLIVGIPLIFGVTMTLTNAAQLFH